MNKEKTVPAKAKKYTRLSKRSKIVTTIMRAIEDKKGYDIVMLDLRKIEEAVADFFIVASADSYIQTKAIINEIEKSVKENCQQKPMSVDGESKQGWMVLDYFDVAAHIFLPEEREKYRLEELWGDAE